MKKKRWRALSNYVLNIRNRYLLFLDIITLPLAAYLAFVLRLERADLGKYLPTALISALLALLVKLPIFMAWGGYSRYWPFASLSEIELIVVATTVGGLVSMGIEIVLAHLLGFLPTPRSVPFIAIMLTGLALAGPRLGMRLLYAASSETKASDPGRRVLIVGAGEAGNVVVQEIHRNPQLGLQPVGFVDDDAAKQGLNIRGIKVLGTTQELSQLIHQHRIKKVLIATPKATGTEMRHIVESCQAAGVEALTLPGVFQIISGRVEVQRFRPVQVEDLLAREPIRTDITDVQLLLFEKTVLVTGAGGSIGSELCRQIAHCRPARLALLGHGENSIYQVHRELHSIYPELDIHPIIADIRDAKRLDQVFECIQPGVVVHAAAHKHVPLMELNPEEAVTNNVGGTKNLLQTCARHNVKSFVMISTDKAVNPTSTMGATKRIAEHLVQAAALHTGRPYLAVRFGNVLGSRGSVVPLFQSQIESGGPVTVTHPEIERYFMTIPEAVQLVLQAAALGRGGEVFVLDMGKPVKIVDLARDMIRLAGLEEDKDISIVFTGLRPGEKLTEELFLSEEQYGRTLHDKIFVSRNGHVPHNQVWCDDLFSDVDELLAAAADGDRTRLYAALHALVPEYAPTLSIWEGSKHG